MANSAKVPLNADLIGFSAIFGSIVLPPPKSQIASTSKDPKQKIFWGFLGIFGHLFRNIGTNHLDNEAINRGTDENFLSKIRAKRNNHAILGS